MRPDETISIIAEYDLVMYLLAQYDSVHANLHDRFAVVPIITKCSCSTVVILLRSSTYNDRI